MNKERRKAIDQWIGEISYIENRMTATVQEMQAGVQAILGEEQDAFDNMPESLQYSDKGEAAQEAINSLEIADSEIEGWVSDISDRADEIISYLEEAKA